jgi:hypothetical protein
MPRHNNQLVSPSRQGSLADKRVLLRSPQRRGDVRITLKLQFPTETICPATYSAPLRDLAKLRIAGEVKYNHLPQSAVFSDTEILYCLDIAYGHILTAVNILLAARPPGRPVYPPRYGQPFYVSDATFIIHQSARFQQPEGHETPLNWYSSNAGDKDVPIQHRDAGKLYRTEAAYDFYVRSHTEEWHGVKPQVIWWALRQLRVEEAFLARNGQLVPDRAGHELKWQMERRETLAGDILRRVRRPIPPVYIPPKNARSTSSLATSATQKSTSATSRSTAIEVPKGTKSNKATAPTRPTTTSDTSVRKRKRADADGGDEVDDNEFVVKVPENVHKRASKKSKEAHNASQPNQTTSRPSSLTAANNSGQGRSALLESNPRASAAVSKPPNVTPTGSASSRPRVETATTSAHEEPSLTAAAPHPNDGQYKCLWKDCGNQTYPSGQALHAHVVGTHDGQVCLWANCHHQSNSNANLRRHFLTHTGWQPFACNRCHFKSSYKKSVEQHLSLVHKLSTNEVAKWSTDTRQAPPQDQVDGYVPRRQDIPSDSRLASERPTCQSTTLICGPTTSRATRATTPTKEILVIVDTPLPASPRVKVEPAASEDVEMRDVDHDLRQLRVASPLSALKQGGRSTIRPSPSKLEGDDSSSSDESADTSMPPRKKNQRHSGKSVFDLPSSTDESSAEDTSSENKSESEDTDSASGDDSDSGDETSSSEDKVESDDEGSSADGENGSNDSEDTHAKERGDTGDDQNDRGVGKDDVRECQTKSSDIGEHGNIKGNATNSIGPKQTWSLEVPRNPVLSCGIPKWLTDDSFPGSWAKIMLIKAVETHQELELSPATSPDGLSQSRGRVRKWAKHRRDECANGIFRTHTKLQLETQKKALARLEDELLAAPSDPALRRRLRLCRRDIASLKQRLREERHGGIRLTGRARKRADKRRRWFLQHGTSFPGVIRVLSEKSPSKWDQVSMVDSWLIPTGRQKSSGHAEVQ